MKEKYFPLLGRGFARLMGNKEGNISISRLYINGDDTEEPKVILTVKDKNNYSIQMGDTVLAKSGRAT